MTLKQLETFYYVCRLGSFSAAAARLNTTQPGISVRIRELEQSLDVQLLDRSQRSVRLTPKGRALLADAERMLALADDMRRRLTGDGEIAGRVRLGAADSIALSWLPQLVSRVTEAYPAIELELIVDLSVELRRRLANQELDIAILVGQAAGRHVRTHPLGLVSNQWFASPSLGLPDRLRDAAALAEWPILTHSRGSDLYLALQQWFDRQGVRPKRIIACNSLATMIRMTCDGMGVSVLADALLGREVASGALQPIELPRPFPPNSFSIAYLAAIADEPTRVVVEQAIEVGQQSGLFGRGEG